MLRFGILATLLLGSAFYFPVPGSDPCRAVAQQTNAYLYDIGALTGFEAMDLDSMTEAVAEGADAQFSYYPARWGCAINYWRNEADTDRVGRLIREEFKRVLTLKITMETGQEPNIADETVDELFLEYMKKRY